MEPKRIMNFKKLVTLVVLGLTLCFMFDFTAEASTENFVEKDDEFDYTEEDFRYMTGIIYAEANGESYAGKKAVGIVVMNRLRSDLFPDSIEEVLYQSGQFTPAYNGSLNRAMRMYDEQIRTGEIDGNMMSCMIAAKLTLEGSTTIPVDNGNKEMDDYLFFSRYIYGARYVLGGHQFK